MRRLGKTWLGGIGLTVVALAACLAALPAATAVARDHPYFGVDTSAVEGNFDDAPSAKRAARRAAAMGARTERMGLSWKYVQPHPDKPMRWTKFDAEVEAITSAGLRPMIMIHDAPYWARPNSRCSTHHCPPDVAHMDNWAHFAGAVAQRYESDGLVAIEVWNSPNTQPWWPVPGGPDPGEYATLYGWAAGAIHKKVPRLPVLFCSCGANGFKDTNKDLSISTFLRGFYNNVNWPSIATYDGLAIHSYPSKADLDKPELEARFLRVIRDARSVRNVGDHLGSDRNLWFTEVGMTTTGPEKVRVSKQEQAKGMTLAMKALWAMDDVAGIFTFTLVETQFDKQHPQERGYGLLHRGSGKRLVPKPVYCRLAGWRGVPAPRGC